MAKTYRCQQGLCGYCGDLWENDNLGVLFARPRQEHPVRTLLVYDVIAFCPANDVGGVVILSRDIWMGKREGEGSWEARPSLG